MTKIIVTDAVDEKHVNKLRSMDGFEVDFRNGITKDELSSIIGGYDCVVVRSRTKLTSDIIEKATRARLIVRAGVGVDNIDVEAATRRNIPTL
ncbi:MAG: phosphoglycerate dehydrogenase, partial [Candidatus Thermoplasmatota archaeon]|nr:phosphoglycerate dehydrogenase [Candidatus Thermoplasmatota archaeon]